MKPIQPVNIWVNGQQQQADYFNLYITNDNLSSSATFHYDLFKTEQDPPGTIVNQTQLAQGTLTMSEQDYIDWGTSADINLAAYVWAANQLNLTLV